MLYQVLYCSDYGWLDETKVVYPSIKDAIAVAKKLSMSSAITWNPYVLVEVGDELVVTNVVGGCRYNIIKTVGYYFGGKRLRKTTPTRTHSCIKDKIKCWFTKLSHVFSL